MYIIFVFQISYPANKSIFISGTTIWCILLIFLSIVFIIYGALINKYIDKTANEIKHLYDTKQSISITDDYGVNLLLILAACMAINFIFLCISSIYFANNPSQNQTLIYMIIYYIIAIIFLIFLLIMYRDYLYKTYSKNEIIAKNMNENDLGTALTPPEQDIEMNGTVFNTSRFNNNNKGFVPPAPQSAPPTQKSQNYVATMKNNKSQPSMIIASQRKLDGLNNNSDSISVNSNEKMIGKHNTQHTMDGSLIVLDYDINDLDDMENERLEEEEIERQELEEEEKQKLELEKQRLELEKEKLKKEEEEKEKQRLEEEKLANEFKLKREESLLNHLMDDIIEEKDIFGDWDDNNDDTSEELDDFTIDENNIKKQPETIDDLLQIELPKNVENILGNIKTIKKKIPKDKKKKAGMERDLRKVFNDNDVDDDDEDAERFSKLAVLKWYDILIETFIKYCKIGGDNDWLTIKGWEALYKDGFIADKKIINEKCTENECYELFNIIYDKYNSFGGKKMSLRQSQILKKGRNKFSTRKMILDEWNDDDPWTGIWKDENEDSDETYIIKQVGDKKLMGYIKSFEFCDINGSLKNDKTKCEMMVFWHKGARRNRRRLCRCILNKPLNSGDAITMTIQWKSIAVSSIVDQISSEKGIYTMVKMKKDLTNKEENEFKYKIGLARHEYLDAMLHLSIMKFYNDKNLQKYAKLNKLCEDNLIPFIWGGMENAQEASLKQTFRPYSTELHRLFDKYNIIDSNKENKNSLMNLNEWCVLCQDIFKQDKNAFLNGGKPNKLEIKSSYELAKEGYDLQLTYRLFQKALANLAHKIYKRAPKAKYNFAMRYLDKLNKLLKWAKKLEKSGYIPQQF